MAETWIHYRGTGYPVTLGSEIKVRCYVNDADIARIETGKLVTYESYEHNGHESSYKEGFYWKLYNGEQYFNFHASEIEYYQILKPSTSDPSFDELAVCKDLIWTLFHGSETGSKFRGIAYLRKEHDLRNSEICKLLGLKSEDIDFILNNKEG